MGGIHGSFACVMKRARTCANADLSGRQKRGRTVHFWQFLQYLTRSDHYRRDRYRCKIKTGFLSTTTMPKPSLDHTKSIGAYSLILRAHEDAYRAIGPDRGQAEVISEIAQEIKDKAKEDGAKLPDSKDLRKV